jgi:hypothetical protein
MRAIRDPAEAADIIPLSLCAHEHGNGGSSRVPQVHLWAQCRPDHVLARPVQCVQVCRKQHKTYSKGVDNHSQIYASGIQDWRVTYKPTGQSGEWFSPLTDSYSRWSQVVFWLQSNLSLQSPACFNGHLCYAATLFLSLCPLPYQNNLS